MARFYVDEDLDRIDSIRRMAEEQDDPDRVLREITWLISERERLIGIVEEWENWIGRAEETMPSFSTKEPR